MRVLSLRNTAIILAAGIGLSGCATYGPYGGLGVGVGYGNGGYGYDPYYGGGYYGGGYGYNSPYGYGGYYGSSYYGWNDGFYYPGTGYYVYDSYRRPHRWTDAQRRYWEQRQRAYRDRNRVGFLGENWREFRRDRGTATSTGTTVTSNAERLRSRDLVRTNTVSRERTRSDRSQSWVDRRRSQLERAQTRDNRRESRRRDD